MKNNHNMLIHVSDKERSTIEKHIQQCIDTSSRVNIKKLATELGVKEIREESVEGAASGYMQNKDGKYIIGVEKKDSELRQRFTIAHELAHYLLHRNHICEGDSIVDSRIYRSNLTSDLEVEANRLAADLVMPMNLLRHFASITSSITYNQLSEKLGVSLQALKVRLGVPY